MREKIRFFLAAGLLLLLTACNGQAATPPPSATPPADLVATLVQATLTAVSGPRPAAAATTPPLAATPLASPTPTFTPTVTATPTITPTYAPPVLYFQGATNCRYGPGTAYPVRTVVQSGEQADILGRYQENYWQVRLADGTVCWAAGDAARTDGSVHLVPTVEPPPTPTPQPPRRPIGLRYFYTCQADGSVTVELTWQDLSDNEAGYRIYRDGILLVELPPNSSAWTDLVPVQGSYRYEFSAFNGGGEARTSMTADINCY